MKMWSVMLECHQIQLHAISQAKNIDSMIDTAKFGDAHMDLIKRLELQLLDWIACFVAWVSVQKNYVKTLNQWLRNGVIYVPEETEDGAPPFSPGRLGGPPIFVICNNWAASVDRISEKEVVEAMQAFASNVLNLWERHRSEQRQGLMANKGMDRDLRVMERDEQSMRRLWKNKIRSLCSFRTRAVYPCLHKCYMSEALVLKLVVCKQVWKIFLRQWRTSLLHLQIHTRSSIFARKKRNPELHRRVAVFPSSYQC